MDELEYIERSDYDIWGIVTGSHFVDGVFHRNEFVVNRFSMTEAWARGTMVASSAPVFVPAGRIEYCYRLTEAEASAFRDSLTASEKDASDGVAALA